MADVATADRRQLEFRLEREVGHDADHVGVAAALAVAVDGGLHVAHAGGHRRQRVGHRQLGVVVRMDAPRDLRRIGIGRQRVTGVDEDVQQLVGERAAVGVAEHEVPRTRLARSTQRVQGVRAVRLVAVEVVFRVIDHGPSLLAYPTDGIRRSCPGSGPATRPALR